MNLKINKISRSIIDLDFHSTRVSSPDGFVCSRYEPEKYDHFIAGRSLDPGVKPGFAPTGYCDSKLMNALFTKQLAGQSKTFFNKRIGQTNFRGPSIVKLETTQISCFYS